MKSFWDGSKKRPNTISCVHQLYSDTISSQMILCEFLQNEPPEHISENTFFVQANFSEICLQFRQDFL